jgi:hypothetical protein
MPDKRGVDELDERRHFAVPDRPQIAEFGHRRFAGRFKVTFARLTNGVRVRISGGAFESRCILGRDRE